MSWPLLSPLLGGGESEISPGVRVTSGSQSTCTKECHRGRAQHFPGGPAHTVTTCGPSLPLRKSSPENPLCPAPRGSLATLGSNTWGACYLFHTQQPLCPGEEGEGKRQGDDRTPVPCKLLSECGLVAESLPGRLAHQQAPLLSCPPGLAGVRQPSAPSALLRRCLGCQVFSPSNYVTLLTPV